MTQPIPEFDLAGQASEIYLAGTWLRAAGKSTEAARKLHAAARLWHEAAQAMSGYSPSESIRQRVNQVVALFDAGDIPQAQSVGMEVDQAIALATMPSSEARESLAREWADVKQQRADLLTRYSRDWARVQREAKSHERLDRLPRATIDLLLSRYPGLPRAHYLAYLHAQRRGKMAEAKLALLQALEFDPTNDSLAALLLGLMDEMDPAEIVAAKADELLNRLGREASASFVYLCALVLLKHYESTKRRRQDLLLRATDAANRAITMPAGNLKDRAWAWAHVIHQYCRWRLGEPGVECPHGRRFFQRGVSMIQIDVPPVDDADSRVQLLDRISREVTADLCA